MNSRIRKLKESAKISTRIMAISYFVFVCLRINNILSIVHRYYYREIFSTIISEEGIRGKESHHIQVCIYVTLV